MTQSMGVPVIVEAKPGAGGNIGADTVAKAAPDGYTILMGTIGTNAINQTLYKSMPYQPLKDLVAVTQVVLPAGGGGQPRCRSTRWPI